MARDAMEGYIGTLLEDGEPVPENDHPQTQLRFDQLALTLRRNNGISPPLFEGVTSQIAEAV